MLGSLRAAAIGRLVPAPLVVSAVLAGASAFANDKITAGTLRFTSHYAGFIAFERGICVDR